MKLTYLQAIEARLGNNAAPAQCLLPPQILKDFAGVGGRVQRAVAAAPSSITLETALKQIRSFSQASSKIK